MDMEAVIKSAASAASRKTKSKRQDPGKRAATARQADGGRPGRFPGSWSPGFGLPGGCTSSQLDHGFQIQNKEPQVSKTQKRVPKPFQTLSNPFKTFPDLFKPFQNLSRASPRSENQRKGIPNHQKGVRNFPKPSKTTKRTITRHIRIQIRHF